MTENYHTQTASHYLEAEFYDRLHEDRSILDFIDQETLDGIWYWDLEQREEEWMSPRFWQMFGYDPAQMPHKASAWQSIIFAEDLKRSRACLQKHLSDPSYPFDLELRYRHKAGNTVWVRCRGMVMRDMAGNPIRMLGVHQNITLQKQRETKLLKDNERLRNILTATHLGTWEWNVQTGETRFNEYWANFLGYSLQELMPTNIQTWERFTHPVDLQRSAEELERHFNGETEYYLCNARMRHKNGHWIWVQDRGQVVSKTADGKPLWMMGSHIEITEQKAMEDQLREQKHLLDTSNQVARIGTWNVDLDSMQLVWSDVTRAIHEVDDAYIPKLEDGFQFFLEGDDRQSITTHFDQAMQDGIPFDLELRILTARQHLRWVRTVGTPEMQHGNCVRVYGVFQDITERKEVAVRNEHLLDVATNQNKRLLNFAHIVSHNLRSHAANFKMMLDLIDMSKADEWDEILRHLRSASNSLSETVGHLNEVVVMNHQADEQLISIDLTRAVSTAFDHFSGILKSANAQVEVQIPAGLSVLGLPAYLDSIFTNLISNALRYASPKRALVLKVEAAAAAGKVHISVTDNGLGIDLRQHGEKIFGMYKTFHQHPEAKGIGLFIVKNQVEAMYGQITIESEVDRFTTFTIILDEAI